MSILETLRHWWEESRHRGLGVSDLGVSPLSRFRDLAGAGVRCSEMQETLPTPSASNEARSLAKPRPESCLRRGRTIRSVSTCGGGLGSLRSLASGFAAFGSVLLGFSAF